MAFTFSNSEDIRELQLILREESVAFFSEEELQYYLDKNDGNIENTAYECFTIKAEDTSLTISGMTTADTSKYFLRLAAKYRPNNSGILRGDF